MTLIDKAEALAIIMEECWKDREMRLATRIEERIAALPARGVEVKPDAAEMLAKEMQAIVAADRWKGRDLSATPPEKWSHLRPETQQFWIDTATRILASISPTPAPTDAAHVNEAPKSEHDAGNMLTAAQAREAALREAVKALRNWQDDLNANRMSESAVTVGMAADVVIALIGETRT